MLVLATIRYNNKNQKKIPDQSLLFKDEKKYHAFA